MASQGKLYKMGLRPVWRVSPDSMKWKRQQGMLKWDQTDDGFCISFAHCFQNFNQNNLIDFLIVQGYNSDWSRGGVPGPLHPLHGDSGWQGDGGHPSLGHLQDPPRQQIG